MLFTLKKIVGGLIMPLPMFMMALVLVFILIWRKHYRLAQGLLGLMLVFLYVLSTPPAANGLLLPLESQYSKYQDQAVDAIVVLGGYHHSDDLRPITSLLSAESLSRLSEGVRLHGLNPGSTLHFSGYSDHDPISHAEAMAKVAMSMGVDPAVIQTNGVPKDTADEAAFWASELNGRKVALVTSASHMPRAMFLFTRAGLDPIPAPTHFRSGKVSLAYWRSWMPSDVFLNMSRVAWHEYLGLTWAKMNLERP